MQLKGAVALVTGASEGIGRAIAEALVREGARVTITGRRENELQAAADAIGAEWITGDVGVEADAVRTVRFTGVLMQVPGSETNASVIGAGQFQMPVSVAGETEGSTSTISVFGGMMLTKPVIQIQ